MQYFYIRLSCQERTEWFAWIEKEFAGKYKRIERYALKKEGDIFDRDRLEQYVAKIEKDYEIRLIEKEDVAALMQEEWSHDFCCNYKDANDFMQRGIGVLSCDDLNFNTFPVACITRSACNNLIIITDHDTDSSLQENTNASNDMH